MPQAIFWSLQSRNKKAKKNLLHWRQTEQEVMMQMNKCNIDGKMTGRKQKNYEKSNGGTALERECAIWGAEDRARTANWWRGHVSVFVLSHRQAMPNTLLMEQMSVSAVQLEAGRPSCDSM